MTFSWCPTAQSASVMAALCPVSVDEVAYPAASACAILGAFPVAEKELVEPANPPLATPRYLPFQPELGNQTSNSMFESLEGRITPCTRQKAGSFLNSASCAAFGVLSGTENSLAGTVRAIMIE